MTVALVGAGPGDPGLVTVRGLELLHRCEVVLYDRLVAPELVAEAPPQALRIPREGLVQSEVNELLVAEGRRGLAVVRLKGGDPFLFGRGGEEALALAAAGVPFEVVPGVSSLAAVPAGAGIPLTSRGVASQVTAVTGHEDGALDFQGLARAPGTLIFFMALKQLDAVARGLVAQGKDPATPAAVIASGTLPQQRSVRARLDRIAHAARELDPPALLVVGEVVALAERLAAAPVVQPPGRLRAVSAPEAA